MVSNGLIMLESSWKLHDDSDIVIDSELCPQDAVNNVLFLCPHLATPHEYRLLPSGLNYSGFYNDYLEQLKKSATELNVSLQSNPYANVLYDSIWAFALAVNRSLRTLKARSEAFLLITSDTLRKR